jgi:putative SOS response-associated peptidase YedK
LRDRGSIEKLSSQAEEVTMCNLYTVRKSAEEVAAHFGVKPPITQINTPDEALPGYPGMVVREDRGERIPQSMVWGWPLRLQGMKLESKPKPVNNIADVQKKMWVGFARKPEWRCIIPLTEFAEAEGQKGSKTRTWFSLRDQPVFAWAGLWRHSAEWGAVYSGMMTAANEAIQPVHDRMPVLLLPEDYDRWLHGSLEDVVAFQQRVFRPDLIEMNRTPELWVKRKPSAAKRRDGEPADGSAGTDSASPPRTLFDV